MDSVMDRLRIDHSYTEFYPQFNKIFIILHFFLLFIWEYYLGKSLINISSKSSKDKNSRFEVRNLLTIVATAITIIYFVYKLFFDTYTVNTEYNKLYEKLFTVVLIACVITHSININHVSYLMARIIKPRLRLVYFIALFFWPLGVWYAQPKLSKIKTRKIGNNT